MRCIEITYLHFRQQSMLLSIIVNMLWGHPCGRRHSVLPPLAKHTII